MESHLNSLDQAQDETLRLLLENLPHSYIYQVRHSADGAVGFIYVSPGAFAVHGLKPAEIMAAPGALLDLVDPAFLPEYRRLQAASKEQMSDFLMELRVSHRDGRWRWVELRSRPRREADGAIIWDGVATDITERYEQKALLDFMARRAQVLLELPQLEVENNEREFMQQVLNRLENLTGSRIGFMHFVNPDQESIELVAWSSDTLGKYCNTPFETHYPVSQAGLWADAARRRETVVINDYPNEPHKHGLPEGHSPLQRLISVPIMEDDDVCMITGVGNKADEYTELDIETLLLVGQETWRIVARRRMEKALRIASQVVNASPVVCFRWRAEDGWPAEYVSDNVEQWGYSTQEILEGKPAFSQMIHPEDLPRIESEVTGYTANGLNTYLQEYRLLTRDQQTIWVEDRTIVQRDRDGKALYYDGVVTDVSERHHRQENLSATLAAQRQLNKRLEEAHNQLLQSEKMASIGQLAAGIAHELNNPIGFVHSNLGTLEGYLHDLMDIIDAYDACAALLPVDARERGKVGKMKEERDFDYVRDDIFNLLAESRDGLSRVRKIVQDLKSFSHVGEQEWQPANLHQGLDSTLNIVWNELKYKCTVIKDYGDLPDVYCLISQLNQVFMNLLVNAGQAIESKGEITLRTRRHGSDQVAIEICDTGKGIEAAHLNRIFEPFFTTKPVGKGTGLGLSLSYSIIQRHHGRIEVDSTPGRGTCFRVIIPIAQPGSNTSVPENPS